MENKTDELIRKIYRKKERKEPKRLIKVSGEDDCNKWLPGLRGDSLTKYDRQVTKLFQSSDDPFLSKLGKSKYFGFCTPCSIQKEVRSRFHILQLNCLLRIKSSSDDAYEMTP